MAMIDGWVFSLALAGGIFYVMSLSMPGWVSTTARDSTSSFFVQYIGLWERCSYMDGVLEVNDKFAFMRVVDITASFGFFLLIGSLVCAAVLPCITEAKKGIVRKFLAALAIFAVLFMLAALVVFGINTDLSKLHAAFGMSAAAALLTLIGAILALCSRSGGTGMV